MLRIVAREGEVAPVGATLAVIGAAGEQRGRDGRREAEAGQRDQQPAERGQTLIGSAAMDRRRTRLAAR